VHLVEFGDLVQRISDSVGFPLLSAFLIGIMAAISPCPLATNISAMAYISRNITDRRYVVTSGILYTLGRTVSYFIIGALVIAAGASVPNLSLFLQDAGETFLGPLLIVVGILLLGIVRIPFLQGSGRLASLGERVAKRGRLGAFLLGVVSFCPYTAILFFGILVPLALESTAGITLPASFAVGTGLPVLVFAVLLSFGVTRMAQWLNVVTAAEKIIRKVVALTFIGAGIYFVVLWVQN
jgi:cytochrome c biogenesis protein CcdA